MTTTAPPIDARDTRDDERYLTILEHLRELRNRVIICVLALVVGIGVSLWPLTKYAIDFLVRPAQKEIPGFQLHQFQLLDYWSTYFKVSMLLGLAMAMPVILYEILAFVGPGLTKQERRWLYPIVIGASLMFVAGMAFAYYAELPPALRFLLQPNTDDVVATIGVQTYIDTVVRLLFITGLVFEMPLVIMGLAKIWRCDVEAAHRLVAVCVSAGVCAGGHRHAIDRPDHADRGGGADHRALHLRRLPGAAGRGQLLPGATPLASGSPVPAEARPVRRSPARRRYLPRSCLLRSR